VQVSWQDSVFTAVQVSWLRQCCHSSASFLTNLMQDIPMCFQWQYKTCINGSQNTTVFITIYYLRSTRRLLRVLGRWRAWWWLEGVETCSPEVVDRNKNCCVLTAIYLSCTVLDKCHSRAIFLINVTAVQVSWQEILSLSCKLPKEYLVIYFWSEVLWRKKNKYKALSEKGVSY
jgi:hypothetical protein